MFSAAPHVRFVQDGCSRRPLGRGGPSPAGSRDPGSTGGRRLHHARHAHRTHHGARLHGRREGGRHDQTRLGLRQLITSSGALFSQFEITSEKLDMFCLNSNRHRWYKKKIGKLLRLPEL